MGEILQDSEEFILQWWDVIYDKWQSNSYCSLNRAKEKMAEMKALDKMYYREKSEYRIVRETTKQEVVYDEFEN
jgi:hypothetical protein